MRVWHWFRDQSTALQGAAASVAILGAGAAGISYVTSAPAPFEVSIPSGIHFTFEEWEEKQRDLRTQIEAELEQAHAEDRDQLLAQLSEVHNRLLNNAQDAYQQELARLERLQADLDTLRGQVPEEQLKAAEAALTEGDPAAADALFAQVEDRGAEMAATAAYARGEIAESAIRWADAAKHYARAADLAPTYDRLYKAASFAERVGDYQSSVGYAEDLVSEARQGASEKALAAAMNTLAISLENAGRLQEAEALYRKVIDIDVATVGREHPTYAGHLTNLASVLASLHKLDEAEKLLRQAIENVDATEDQLTSQGATRLHNLANLLLITGRLDEAEQLYLRVVQHGENTLGTSHPYFATRLNNLAGLYFRTGRYAQAERYAEQALAIYDATFPKGHPDADDIRRNLATIRAKIP